MVSSNTLKPGQQFYFTWVVLLFLAVFIVFSPHVCLAQNSTPDKSEAERLDKKALSMIEKAGQLEAIDGIDEAASDKICQFATTYQKAEWIKTRVYKTPFHDDVAMTLQNLASLYQICHAPMAREYLQSVLQIKQKLYSKESEATAGAHDALGDYYRLSMMAFKKAISHYHQARDIRIKLYGKDDPRITQNYGVLAITLFYHKSDKQAALKLLTDSVKMRKNSPADKTIPVWAALADLADFYYLIQEEDKALACLKKALETPEEKSSKDQIRILSQLGFIHLNQDDLKQSFHYARLAYDKAKAGLQNDTTAVLLAQIEQLKEICSIMGDVKSVERLEAELKDERIRLHTEL